MDSEEIFSVLRLVFDLLLLVLIALTLENALIGTGLFPLDLTALGFVAAATGAIANLPIILGRTDDGDERPGGL